ncbi:unnamed protein product [Tilletia laevis]|uniref:Uncharacterized protein n=1 Tax=Tilletia laevis TaxID=157183 RepID=A0A9N8LW99_9BASI|nr:unnamed protein product [Tilletia laevis]
MFGIASNKAIRVEGSVRHYTSAQIVPEFFKDKQNESMWMAGAEGLSAEDRRRAYQQVESYTVMGSGDVVLNESCIMIKRELMSAADEAITTQFLQVQHIFQASSSSQSKATIVQALPLWPKEHSDENVLHIERGSSLEAIMFDAKDIVAVVNMQHDSPVGTSSLAAFVALPRIWTHRHCQDGREEDDCGNEISGGKGKEVDVDVGGGRWHDQSKNKSQRCHHENEN